MNRMVWDAKFEEIRRQHEEIEARNNADSMAYQVERQIRDLGNRLPPGEKSRADELISEIRELVSAKSNDVERLRQLTSDLQQIGYALSEYGQHKLYESRSG